MRFLFLFTLHQLVDVLRKFANSASKVIMLRCNRYSGVQEHTCIYFETKPNTYTKKLWIQVFVKKWKFLAYH